MDRTRFLSLALACCLALSCLAMPAAAEEGDGFANFQKINEYYDGLFEDVENTGWVRDSVAAAYELGLMRGNGNGLFNVAGSVTFAEAVTLSARLHQIYATGNAEFPVSEPWYQVYADYALEHGLIAAAPEDYGTAATRSAFAAILARALPEEALPAVNTVEDGAIPDVRVTDENAAEIYRLYRAGILTGNNEKGVFAPESEIIRSQVAAIVGRMAYRSLRQKTTLLRPAYPDLEERPAAEDAFFSGSAVVGNSMVQGLWLYSGLSTPRYYGIPSTSVKNPNHINSADDQKNTFDEMLKSQYDRVYMEYGINEIYMKPEEFTEAYGKLIDRIREKMPEAEIYVMAITPVTKAKSDEGSYTMARVNALNGALREMCAEKECWFLDCCTPLEDENGYLKQEYNGWDGVHLGNSGYRVWADVIRTHYA